MKYGLIGKTLSYSYSKEIYESLGYPYDLVELNEDKLDSFLRIKDFVAINVTIPYKTKVIDYLDYVSEEVKSTSSCNLIVNKNGILYGYNTDYFGFLESLKFHNINLANDSILILGTGATSRSVTYALNQLNISNINYASRNDKFITYDYLKNNLVSYQTVINTTPVGTSSTSSNVLLHPESFSFIKTYIDVIYNPLVTMQARLFDKGVKRISGLYMLVSQAIKSLSYIQGIPYDYTLCNDTYYKMLLKHANIVLIGMPSSGKTTTSLLLAPLLQKNVLSTDKLIEDKTLRSCKDIINSNGIDYFRKIESDVLSTLQGLSNVIIDTGGGVVENIDNMNYLQENSIIIYLKKDYDSLKITSDRPLIKSKEDLEIVYKRRTPLYEKYSDIIIDNKSIDDTIHLIMEELKKVKK